MAEQIKSGLFLEYANVHGNLYGTSISSVEEVIRQNRRCLLDIDVQGVSKVMQRVLDATYILITPPSVEELSRRLHLRNTDSEDSIQLRLRNSEQELLAAQKLAFTHTILNDDVERAYHELKEILLVSIV